jgi:putative endopeptidase
MKVHVLAGVLGISAMALTGVAAQVAGGPKVGTFGFDEAGMDRSVAPGDEFFEFANGNWDRKLVIPADRAYFGVWDQLDENSLTDTRAILDDDAKDPTNKVGNYYASFLDEKGVDAKGVAPAKPILSEIYATKDRSALAAEQGKLERIGASAMFRMNVGQDDKAPDHYIIGLRQGGLGMPDREYYLKDDAKSESYRAIYIDYVAKLLSRARLADPAAARDRAQRVFDFEKRIAAIHWTRAASRDADKTYNKWTRADFVTKAPGYDWDAYFGTVGGNTSPTFLVSQPTAFTEEAKIFAETPLSVLQDRTAFAFLNSYAEYLSKPFVDANFDAVSKGMMGVPENQPRWKRGVALVESGMGEAVGKDYVARYFPPATKAAADTLVHNLIVAMEGRLRKLEWMDPATKVKAVEKLAAFTPKIGYPASWRDYSALQIDRGDLLGNVMRARAFEHQRQLNHLGQPIDRAEWFMNPMAINAYANPGLNEVVFPAAVLQPPFFDPKADPAINYGGIGAIIGHEISHHFDDQGRKYDKTGKLTDWWTPQDVARFKVLTDRLVKQSSGYEVLPGVHLQGETTLGENIADLAGITVAFDAYHASLGGKPAPVIDGLTGDQRFFLGFAQAWRTKTREDALRQQVMMDFHSPDHQRALTTRNIDGWYAAFSAKPGQRYYLSPADRVRIW